jgi:hypothetical protein
MCRDMSSSAGAQYTTRSGRTVQLTPEMSAYLKELQLKAQANTITIQEKAQLNQLAAMMSAMSGLGGAESGGSGAGRIAAAGGPLLAPATIPGVWPQAAAAPEASALAEQMASMRIEPKKGGYRKTRRHRRKHKHRRSTKQRK